MSDSPIRVLLVDDEAAIRRALRTPLNELGFQTAEASRGEEALHLVRTKSSMSCSLMFKCRASVA